MASRRATVGVAVVTAALAVTAACGSSSSKSSTSGTGTGSGDVAGAQAAIQPLLTPPTSAVAGLPQLTKKPAAGKKMIITETPEPVTIKVNDGMVQAANALGWTTTRISIGTGAEDPAKALNAAIDQKPDLIVQTGAPASQLREPLQRARDQHIVVLRSDNTDPVAVDGTVVNTGIDGAKQTGAWGTMTADYAIATTKGNPNVLVVDFPTYPILTAYADGFDTELKAKCPSCKTTRLNQQVTDLAGGKTPAAVVSALQRDPSINWVMLSLGDATLGLKAALRAAGLGTKVQIGGESASQANITALKKGDEDVWTAFPAAILGWRRIDAAARYYNGESLAPAADTLLPTMLATQQNVNSIPLDPTGYTEVVSGYQQQFLTLWKVTP